MELYKEEVWEPAWLLLDLLIGSRSGTVVVTPDLFILSVLSHRAGPEL